MKFMIFDASLIDELMLGSICVTCLMSPFTLMSLSALSSMIDFYSDLNLVAGFIYLALMCFYDADLMTFGSFIRVILF